MKTKIKIIALSAVFLLVTAHAATTIPDPADVPASHWANQFVRHMISENWLGVDTQNKFFPDQALTRADTVALLLRSIGASTTDEIKTPADFTDVKSTHPRYLDIITAVDRGFVSGFKNNTFRPDEPVTRAQFLKLLFLAQNEPLDLTGATVDFPDVTDWSIPYVAHGVKTGLVNGFPDKTFRPNLPVNRSAASKLVYLFLENQRKVAPQLTKSSNIAVENTTFLQNKYEKILFLLINISRDELLGKPSLILDPDLSRAAREHAQYLADSNIKSDHTGKNNSTPFDRIKKAGVEYTAAAENIGWSSSNTRSIVESILAIHQDPLSGMMSEPDSIENHRSNILSTFYDFDKVGIGIVITRKNGNREVRIVEKFISSPK